MAGNGHTNARSATGAADAAMNAPHIQILTVEAGAHDENVGSLCAQKLAPEFVTKKAAIACHKMTNVMGRPRHMMLFEVTDISPIGAVSERAVAPVDLTALADLDDAVQM